MADEIKKFWGGEIRYYRNEKTGELEVDEIVCKSPGFFHLEQMDDGHWWMALDSEDRKSNIHINLSTRRNAVIRCTAEVNL